MGRHVRDGKDMAVQKGSGVRESRSPKSQVFLLFHTQEFKTKELISEPLRKGETNMRGGSEEEGQKFPFRGP